MRTAAACARAERGRRYVRRPRVGDVIIGATGEETVEAVHDYGRRLVVRDRLGRLWDRERAPHGCWTFPDPAEATS